MRMEGQDEAMPMEPPVTVGAKLRVAREAAGLGREDIAAQTKIAERQLAAIEEDRLADLAARTYAIGFARAYARAVGLDEGEIADAVRTQLDKEEQAHPRVQFDTFEPGDPARVPSARLAWTAAIGGVVAVLVLLILFWPSFLSPQGSLPDLLREEVEDEVRPVASAIETPARQGAAAVFTATEPRVWVKFYDAHGAQLFQKEMAEGERFVVPADAEGPLLWTARPDALAITVGGKSVARLSERPVTVKDVPVSAPALLAREAADPTRAAAAPAPGQTAASSSAAVSQVRPIVSTTPDPAGQPQPTPSPQAASAESRGAAAPVSTDSAVDSTFSE
jgi:cytoskeleton protein RodZ